MGLLLLMLASAVPAEQGYVGSQVCARCHGNAAQQWQRSHHALAMQATTSRNFQGGIAPTILDTHDGPARVYRRAGELRLQVPTSEGQASHLAAPFVLGVFPLQQLLLPMADGRWQAYNWAWDSRPKHEGGQRWYDLHGATLEHGDSPDFGEPLHWTGRENTANFMCLPCHVTAWEGNYDAQRKRYNSRWSELGVGCEGCHGPGQRHVELAQRGQVARQDDAGLAVRFAAGRGLVWAFPSPDAHIARPVGDVNWARQEQEACYPCHARRQALHGQGGDQGRVPVLSGQPGAAFLDHYQPLLLEPDLYYPDGQIKGEAFEYGSFVQSAMYRAGVGCVDCHHAHTGGLRAEGNALCNRCHQAKHYDQASHHHHPVGSTGAQCVSCHMPSRTYMGVHVRHDHSLRIPRPDLSPSTGAPHACQSCHADQEATWAARQMAQWAIHNEAPHFSVLIALARRGAAQAEQWLALWSLDVSAWLRASFLALRADAWGGPQVAQAARDRDDLVRLGAAKALAQLPGPMAATLGGELLSDPRRAVRVEAARSLAGLNLAVPGLHIPQAMALAQQELLAMELGAAERPESHVNVAQLYARRGQWQAAEAALQTALQLDPLFAPALVNLADLLRVMGRDQEEEAWLRLACRTTRSHDGAPAHALGLWLLRHQRLAEALPWLEQAVRVNDPDGRYTRVLVLAQLAAGQPETAHQTLAQGLERLPGNRVLLQTRATMRVGR